MSTTNSTLELFALKSYVSVLPESKKGIALRIVGGGGETPPPHPIGKPWEGEVYWEWTNWWQNRGYNTDCVYDQYFIIREAYINGIPVLDLPEYQDPEVPGPDQPDPDVPDPDDPDPDEPIDPDPDEPIDPDDDDDEPDPDDPDDPDGDDDEPDPDDPDDPDGDDNCIDPDDPDPDNPIGPDYPFLPEELAYA